MKAAGILVVLIAACAMGGSTQQTDASANHDSSVKHDAAAVTEDAKVFHDAPVSHLDAFVPQDAPPMGGGFCSDNTNCIPGQCCFVAVCVNGTAVGTTLCFPS